MYSKPQFHKLSSLRKRQRQGTILDLKMSLFFWSILRIKGMLREMGGPGMWSCLHGICPMQLLPSFLSPLPPQAPLGPATADCTLWKLMRRIFGSLSTEGAIASIINVPYHKNGKRKGSMKRVSQ